MASTIATLVTTVKNRLLIGTATGEPSDPIIDEALRDAFRWLIATIPPVRETGITTGTASAATLPAETNRVFFVTRGPKVLFRSEWAKQGSDIAVLGSSVGAGDELTAYYTVAYDLTEPTVETSSIFGTDWLEPAAIVMASLNAYLRLSNRAASRGGDKNAQMYRALEAEREALVKGLTQIFMDWRAEMMQALNDRRESGDIPVVSRRQGVRNESHIDQPLLRSIWEV